MQKILLALSLIIMNLTASAQALIPFVGGNLSWYPSNAGMYSPDRIAGFNGGLLIDLRASSAFSLQTGLQYMSTGGKYITNFSAYLAPPPGEKADKTHAIQLPVMLVLKIGDEDYQHFFAGAGFYIASNLAGQLNFGVGTGVGYRFANNLEIYSFLQKDIGSQFGIAVRYALKAPKQKKRLHGTPANH